MKRRHPTKPDRQMQINHGHNGTHIVVQLPQKVNNMVFTPEQAQAFIHGLQSSKAALEKYRSEHG